MLPDIHLDQITFEEMLEKAKNIIAGCYPEWTDFNYHDPGITLVELFAWMKEIQQYSMNHIGEDHRLKYLKLLGTDVLHRKGAKTYVSVDAAQRIRIPAGCRLEAPGVPFETEEEQMLPGVSLQCAFGWAGRKISFLDREQLALGHSLEFYPFGKEPVVGNSLFLNFSGPLPVGERLCLNCWVGDKKDNPRNPVKEDTVPLAKMKYTFWNGTSYQPLEILQDETFGFLFDGQLVFRLPEEIKERKVDQETGFYLRIQLEESQYDMPPVLRFLDINTLRVRQKETVAAWLEAEKVDCEKQLLSVSHGLCAEGKLQLFQLQDGRYREVPMEEVQRDTINGGIRIRTQCTKELFEQAVFYVLVSQREDWYQRHQVLGVGRGFPGEYCYLEEEVVAGLEVELLVEEPENPGVYQKWEQKRDFSNSGPEDCHYCVDSVNGKIIFGDCIHGMAPEGQILLVSYARILGNGGNVKAHKISHFVDEHLRELTVTNSKDAFGGRDEESITEAFARVRSELAGAKNMVTAQDYELAVRSTPGLRIESCKALVGSLEPGDSQRGQIIQLVVKPCSLEKHPKLKPALVENIRKYLEPKRMLGVGIQIVSPIYGKVSVYLEVSTYPQYQGARQQIRQAIKEYLSPYQKEFGCSISYSGLYGYIDRLKCVAGVRSLVLDVKGNGMRRNSYGDLLFPGNGVIDEIEIQCSCSVEE